MSVHSFGGAWTERKLSVVRRYLEMYAQALKNQAFQRIYIDAFAGTGDRTDKRRETLPLLDLPEFEEVAKGSARLALEVEPPFHRYVLIERATRRANMGYARCYRAHQGARYLDIVSVRHGLESSVNEIGRHSAGVAGNIGSKPWHEGMAFRLLSYRGRPRSF
jgi:three-Cys-motif partner protein